MSIDMLVGAAQSQASSVLAKSRTDQQAYEKMIQALQQFVEEERLDAAAYRNAKQYYSAVLLPLVQTGILLSEAVSEACQKFVDEYQATVDSGDLQSDVLEEKIRQLDDRIGHLEAIRATIEQSDLGDNFISRQLNQNSRLIELLVETKKVLQEKLEKLLAFHASSPEIFAHIAELEALVNQGASQAGGAWTGSGFSIPTDLSWTTTVSQKWQARAEKLKKQEQAFHEAKIKELEKYNVYAWPYENPLTKEVRVMWFIDKDGVRLFDEELQAYVEEYGKYLEGIYEIVDWEKIYELDLAARRRGDGKNYLTAHQIPKGLEWMTQANPHIETAYWYASKTGLFDLALIAGLSYAASKSQITRSTSANVANVMDERAETSKKASGAKGKLDVSSKSFESLTADEKKGVESLLEQGKDVKLIPEAPNVSKTPDLLVNGIETEVKTLNGNNINTLVTKVGKALKQVDEKGKIVYDISKANFTPQQMDEIFSRLIGKYGKDITDKITFIK